jgi:hypothetical protein
MLIWRGWGIWGFFLFLFWLVVVLALAGLWLPYQPDDHKSTLELQWGLAAAFVLNAASVFFLDRYRKSHPRRSRNPVTQKMIETPHTDELYYVPLQYWPYLFLGFALIVLLLTVSGVTFF